MSNLSLHDLLKQKEPRYWLCKDSLYLFGIYYFTKYFTHKSPEFHKDRCRDVQNLGTPGNPKYMVDCEFRGSAKTSWTKIDFVRRICYNDRRMMLYGSLDKKIAENALLDIAIELQTNSLLIEDFGQLFYDNNSLEKKSRKQGIGDFLTSNGIRVQAITTGQPIRGMVFGESRPDYVVYDDFENNKTKKSVALTKQVIEHFDEMFPALAPNAIAIFDCNKISDTGSVAWLYDKAENNPDFKVFEKAVVENGEITWEDKYVFTDKEAEKINEEREGKSHVISLESLKRNLNKDGRKVYEQEMLNQPLVDGDRLFNIDLIDKEIERCKNLEPVIDGNWKIWEEYDPLCKYTIGGDVSEGYGLDSSTIEVINITNGEQVAEFCSDSTPPGLLADEFIMASENYGDCPITPERNSIGAAVITSIQEKGYGHLLTRQKVQAKKGGGKDIRYGWNTNSSSKAKMIFDLQEAFNEGYLVINSVPLLREMRGFSNSDLRAASFDEEVSNHFDRVMGIAIANQYKVQPVFALQEKKINMGVKEAGNGAKVSFKRGKFKVSLTK